MVTPKELRRYSSLTSIRGLSRSSTLKPSSTRVKNKLTGARANRVTHRRSQEMNYDEATRQYYGHILQKQGYYSYQYLWEQENGQRTPLPSEGNFYQTEKIIKDLSIIKVLATGPGGWLAIRISASTDRSVLLRSASPISIGSYMIFPVKCCNKIVGRHEITFMSYLIKIFICLQ